MLLVFVGKEGLGHNSWFAVAHLGRDPASQLGLLASHRSGFLVPTKCNFVGKEGLEPSTLSGLVPKTSAYTNSATCPDYYCGHGET